MTEAQELPDQIMVWCSRPELWWLGSWATTRYPEEAVAYVPKADFDQTKNAAELGFEGAAALIELLAPMLDDEPTLEQQIAGRKALAEWRAKCG